jgi:hypothetical protein
MYENMFELNKRHIEAGFAFVQGAQDAVAIANAGADATLYGAPHATERGRRLSVAKHRAQRSTKRQRPRLVLQNFLNLSLRPSRRAR